MQNFFNNSAEWPSLKQYTIYNTHQMATVVSYTARCVIYDRNTFVYIY